MRLSSFRSLLVVSVAALCALIAIFEQSRSIAAVLYQPVGTVNSREPSVVRGEGRGESIFIFRDGRELTVEYRGSEPGVTAFRSATPAAVAVADLDNNGIPGPVGRSTRIPSIINARSRNKGL